MDKDILRYSGQDRILKTCKVSHEAVKDTCNITYGEYLIDIVLY